MQLASAGAVFHIDLVFSNISVASEQFVFSKQAL